MRVRLMVFLALSVCPLGGVVPDGAGAETPAPTTIIERVTSEVVLIEVFATDAKGRPVNDLRIPDLELKIDWEMPPKKISSMEYVEPAPVPAGVAPSEAPAPAGEGGAAPAEGRRRYPRRFLLFFEDSTSSPIGLTQARRAAEQFLERSGQPDDQYAVAAYDERRHLRVLREFTADRESLRKTLKESIEDRGRFSDFVSDLTLRHTEIEQANRAADMSVFTTRSDQLSPEAQRLAESYASQDQQRMKLVLSAVQTLIDALSPWPGYKAIVFMGDGIPENPANEYGLGERRHTLRSDLGELGLAAAASNVTLHTIQTAGLVAGEKDVVFKASRRSNALATLALDTGGVSHDTNDLQAALTAVEADTHAYYLLTYVPEGPPDGRNHSINIKSKRRGVTLRYRRNFVRLLPEEARQRAIQAAYLTPELHAGLSLDLAAVPGPGDGTGRIVDLVLYVPPGQALFLPQPGGPAARLEVGFVALDGEGRETLRLARRVRVGAGEGRDLPNAPLALDFYSRVRLPPTVQTVTAVVSDVQSGSIGAARLSIDALRAASPRIMGLSLYSMDEKSLWIEVAETKGGTREDSVPFTLGPALRSRFTPGEKVRCGFKTSSPGGPDGSGLRIAIVQGDKVLRHQEIEGGAPGGGGMSAAPEGGTLSARLELDGLLGGDYVLRVDEVLSGGTSELGRLPFRVEPKAR
jgi:VWFA-related protein